MRKTFALVCACAAVPAWGGALSETETQIKNTYNFIGWNATLDFAQGVSLGTWDTGGPNWTYSNVINGSSLWFGNPPGLGGIHAGQVGVFKYRSNMRAKPIGGAWFDAATPPKKLGKITPNALMVSIVPQWDGKTMKLFATGANATEWNSITGYVDPAPPTAEIGVLSNPPWEGPGQQTFERWSTDPGAGPLTEGKFLGEYDLSTDPNTGVQEMAAVLNWTIQPDSSTDPMVPNNDGIYGYFARKFHAPRRGDSNMDGTVNFDDLLLLSHNYNKTEGATWEEGDSTGDGAVNFDDLLELSKNYNLDYGYGPFQTPIEMELDLSDPQAAFARDAIALGLPAVPEPMSAGSILILAGCAMAIARRRRR